MRFSERYGYKPVRDIIQKESIDDALLNRLWNIIIFYIFNKYEKNLALQINSPIRESNLNSFFAHFYHSHLKSRVDQIPNELQICQNEIESIFFEEYHWYEIYDFFEFCIENYPFEERREKFIKDTNKILEEENSAYRVINNKITEITSEQEIQSIEDALENTNPFSGVQQHLNQALKLMSDRQHPDYRNSIKESISAVEGLARLLLEDDSITLGKAIPRIKTKYELHPTLMESLNKLYGYTSDEAGVRHGSAQESNLSYIDAKFMLVACTNFINYLIEKTKDQN
ncbi:AbiJ-NTD4 domain-containing protein [Acinetobacter terrestris]|uniref:HEPN AbiJ-N-terminal domain-containing protein n=1 Tax=Acinetobacter terrestris TaxID=2529843 RepID=A0AAW6US90_9GAMM|nr:hypothetical protein [Acinetobacter terrestris]MDK1684622.1 hypothetical protein [Acinetobacter terrestris]